MNLEITWSFISDSSENANDSIYIALAILLL